MIQMQMMYGVLSIVNINAQKKHTSYFVVVLFLLLVPFKNNCIV